MTKPAVSGNPLPPSPSGKPGFWQLAQPFLLVALGGAIASVGQLLAERSALTRLHWEASLTRRSEAMAFLDGFSTVVAERQYAAQDYFYAIQTKADSQTLKAKRDEMFAKRRTMIIQEGIFIARGDDYFGPEFKDVLYKELFVVLGEMDIALQNFVDGDQASAAAYATFDNQATLLTGRLAGVASRHMRDAPLQPPDIAR